MKKDPRIKEVEEGLKRMLKTFSNSFIAKVVSDTDYLVDVEDMSGTTYPEVRKTATEGKHGIIYVLPKDSYVIVSRISGMDELYIAMFSELEGIKIRVGNSLMEFNNDEIKFGDGAKGGLIEIAKLSTEIAKLNTAINILKAATTTGLSGVPGSGAALSSAFTTATVGIQLADLSNITNSKVKH